MRHAVESDDVRITYNSAFREYGVQVQDGGSSVIQLAFCPWCGQKLPESLRQQWFSELEKRGIDPLEDNIPPEFKDERWHKP